MEKEWITTIKKIESLFKQYSADDIAGSLFVLSLWLPNLPGLVKSLYLVSIFVSIGSSEFNDEDKISTYSDFSKLVGELLKLVPEFPSLEDYVPELDWGEVKYSFKDVNYKIFYGSSISHIYDFLYAYQLLYCNNDEFLLERVGKSPINDLRECLALQNWIIENIHSQPKAPPVDNGSYDLPTETFWQESMALFKDENTYSRMVSNIKDFSIELGSLDPKVLTYKNFGNRVMDGDLLHGYFVINGKKIYPILPRRFSEVLIEKWSSSFRYACFTDDERTGFQKKLTSGVAQYLEERFKQKDFMPIVCAVDDGKQPGGLIFSGYFLGKNQLTLIYVTEPYVTQEQVDALTNSLAVSINKDLKLIMKRPVTLGLPRLRKNVQFKAGEARLELEVKVLVVLTQATTRMIKVVFPRVENVDIVFLDQFLGVMDEIGSAEKLTNFLHYLSGVDEQIKLPIITFLDKYASFKHSEGVLVYSANEPNMIILDMQSGSNLRYESLDQFWKDFPDNATIFDHPRAWKIVDANDRLRLSSKHELSSILYAKTKNIDVFTTSPFEDSTYEQGSASDMLMQLIQDYFIRFGDVFSEHRLTNMFRALNIVIIPAGLLTHPKFSRLTSLNPGELDWKIDVGNIGKGFVGLRVVYSEDAVFEKFDGVLTNEIEYKLFEDILWKIDSFVSDPSVIEKVLAEMAGYKGKPPRFTISKVRKPMSFPEFIDPLIPTNYEHKLARKRIAQLALAEGIQPGDYNLEEAHRILSNIRKIVIAEINSEVSKYTYKESLLISIATCDAVIYDYERARIGIQQSLKHDVDFSRKEAYAKMHSDFVHNHKNNRYLIEKFVELKPTGTDYLDSDKLKYLLSLVDKLLEIADASDNLHYGIYQVGLSINRDFVVSMKYEKDVEAMSDEYGEYDAKSALGLVGKDEDKVSSECEVTEFLEKLDKAFLSDFGFGNRDLVNVLGVLSQWPGFTKGVKEATTYSATAEEIDKALHAGIKDFKSDTTSILDFLTLNTKNVREVINSREADDIPVWEHEKRPNRYTLRPLMLFNDRYYWGPCSAERAEHVWMNIVSNGALPFTTKAKNVNDILNLDQVSIQKNLERKALEVVKRYTKFADRVNYSRGTHPKEVGEYDALAYLPDQNILLNIECKVIGGAYCLKDAKTLRDKIFREEIEDGRKVKNPGNLAIVEKREAYLKDNLQNFSSKLGWPIKANPQVFSVYLTRYNYWWTYYPPRKTSVKFMRIDVFDDYLQQIMNPSSVV